MNTEFAKQSLPSRRYRRSETGRESARLDPALERSSVQQQTFGNRAVLRSLAAAPALSPRIQAKCSSCESNDPLEKEADEVAAAIVGERTAGETANEPERACPDCENDEVQAGELDAVVQAHNASQPEFQSLQETPASPATAPVEAPPAEKTAALQQESGMNRTQDIGAATPAETAPRSPAEVTPTVADSPPPVADSSLLVEDSVSDVKSGQLQKAEFLSEARAAVRAAADEVLVPAGLSTQNCPYLETLFQFLSGRSARYIEGLLREFSPDSSRFRTPRDYFPLIAERVQVATRTWLSTGRITGLPRGVPTSFVQTMLPTGSENAARVSFKARSGGARRAEDPNTVRARLGAGSALESGVQSRFGAALGHDFSRVRVHADSTAQKLTNEFSARAFTVGEHVAFGAGEYAPGTPVGDALIAHELAHVIQQGGGTRGEEPSPSLEADADQAAAGAMRSLWGGQRSYGRTALRGAALSLQRCDRRTTTPTTTLTKSTVDPPTVATCGGMTWGVRWGLNNGAGANGWIVQKVDEEFGVMDSANAPVDILARSGNDPAWYPFWEAWQVRNGSVFVGDSESPHNADTFGGPGFGDETYGREKIIGDAQYYPRLTLPPSFSHRADHPARSLPVAISDPGLTGGTGNLDHDLEMRWDCRAASANRTTQYTAT